MRGKREGSKGIKGEKKRGAETAGEEREERGYAVEEQGNDRREEISKRRGNKEMREKK